MCTTYNIQQDQAQCIHYSAVESRTCTLGQQATLVRARSSTHRSTVGRCQRHTLRLAGAWYVVRHTATTLASTTTWPHYVRSRSPSSTHPTAASACLTFRLRASRRLTLPVTPPPWDLVHDSCEMTCTVHVHTLYDVPSIPLFLVLAHSFPHTDMTFPWFVHIFDCSFTLTMTVSHLTHPSSPLLSLPPSGRLPPPDFSVCGHGSAGARGPHEHCLATCGLWK